jgi:vacuolar protein sorting-associated protein 13A/C
MLGLSAATFDSEYQARRRMTQRRNKPRHAMYVMQISWAGLRMGSVNIFQRYGVTAGGEALASSVTSAMEGVLVSIYFSRVICVKVSL